MHRITKTYIGHIGYEYKDVTIDRRQMELYTDAYQNFGWTPEGTVTPPLSRSNAIMLTFKRDRRIANITELTRLERHFEACADEVHTLEHKAASSASIGAFSVAAIATALLAGAMLAFLTGAIPLMVALAIPGFLGWILPCFCYKTIRKNKDARIAPLIERKLDELYDICKRGNTLLAG